MQSNASRTSNRDQFFALHTGVEQEKKKAIEACKQCLGVALTDERAGKGAEKNKNLAVKLLSASQERQYGRDVFHEYAACHRQRCVEGPQEGYEDAEKRG